jgi:hypothetical protein
VYVQPVYRGPVKLSVMLIWGVANPEGEQDGYTGLFLTADDIKLAVNGDLMDGLPVKIEHKGVAVGKVVTAWENKGKMELLIDIDETIFEGNVVSRFVRDNVVCDLSLGYSVGLQFCDKSHNYVAAGKTYHEVSLVKKGARSGCHIGGYSVVDKTHSTKRRKKCDFSSF